MAPCCLGEEPIVDAETLTVWSGTPEVNIGNLDNPLED